jgi:hypothetical protein
MIYKADETGFTLNKKPLEIVNGKGRSLQGLSIVRMLQLSFLFERCWIQGNFPR